MGKETCNYSQMDFRRDLGKERKLKDREKRDNSPSEKLLLVSEKGS